MDTTSVELIVNLFELHDLSMNYTEDITSVGLNKNALS